MRSSYDISRNKIPEMTRTEEKSIIVLTQQTHGRKDTACWP